MQNANDMRGKLLAEFTENYLGKLFYFCLKRTGSQTEAEDLTQDISLQITAALAKGTIPTSFSAWVWQIARNRYSVWAKAKHNRSESLAGCDIGDLVIADEDEGGNILDKMVHTEQMALLRRELAFIKSDYRNIVVAYYIENKNVREIASALSLSVNTVKSRLLRAREILKEGMDMARTFGKRSYDPEEVEFAASGNQRSGLPWSVVGRTIPKNILLQASNNPSTIEELSIELGIALPYMEEEVKILHEATLLEKQGDKYVTNFFIMQKECRIDIYNALRRTAKERSRLIRELIDDKMKEIRALGIAGDHIDDNSVRWWLVPEIIDVLIEQTSKTLGEFDPPKRANGESWGFVGYEITEIPEIIVMGQNGCGVNGNNLWAYKYGDYGMLDQCGEPEFEEASLLFDCLCNGRTSKSFSDIEKEIWERIDGKFAHLSDKGEVIPDILVMSESDYEEFHQIVRKHKNFAALMNNFIEAYETVEGILKKYSHKVLHESLGYYIRMQLYATRMMSIHDLVDGKFLTPPADPSKSSYGMYIILR